ncbi:MAG: Uma2 family endonuclease [Leptolyngbyaceae bacterium]|nr:Uma2 family endonuclease [Leptolyngbyaceae bacterium]
MIASPQPGLTAEEYLLLEAESHIKDEYIDGDVYAMAGASDTHVTIAGNLFALLRNHVRGSGCRVYISAMKVKVEQRNCFYYPDVMVTCDPRDQEIPNYKLFPKVIIEVLSDSTEAFDRGDKFADYQTLESLEEYVLINTRQQRVECFRRGTDGIWLLQYYRPSNDVSTLNDFELQSIDFSDTLAALYEDVALEPSLFQPSI